MRPYASRYGSPARGSSPVRRNAGVTTFVVAPAAGARGVLLPESVFSR